MLHFSPASSTMWINDCKAGHSFEDYLARGGQDPEPPAPVEEVVEETEEEEESDSDESTTYQKRSYHKPAKKRKRVSANKEKRKKVKVQWVTDESSSSSEDEDSSDDTLKKINVKKNKKMKITHHPKKKTERKIDESDDTGDITDTEKFVNKVCHLGKKMNKVKSSQRRLTQVNTMDKGDLKLFTTVISHLWGPKKRDSAFQLKPEELNKFQPYLKYLKEFARPRTSYKRRRAILQEGHLLRDLSELMSELAVEGDGSTEETPEEEEAGSGTESQ